MKLTDEDKEALEDYFAEKQYDPSKDPAQATDGFAQKMMCSGGETGYSKGGPVKMSDGGDPGMGDPNLPLSPLEQMQFNPPPAPSIGIGTTQDAPQGLAAPAAAAETPWMPGPFPPTPPPQAAGNNAQAAFNAPIGETPLGEDASPTPAAATAPAINSFTPATGLCGMIPKAERPR